LADFRIFNLNSSISNFMPSDLPNPLSRNAHWRTIQLVLQIIFCIWLRYRARGMERLPTNGGALLLINHQSYLDPLLVGLPLRRPVSYLARDSLFRVPVIGWILRNTYVMPINREAASTASLREAIRRLEHGFYVGIFPEGTRTTTGEIGTLKPGFLALMRRANVPVYPVGIAGAFQAFPRGSWFLRPAKVRVVFGEAFSQDELSRFDKRQDEELLSFIRGRLLECHSAAEAWRTGVES
jgi:1-acyl-sn-glycerol-3-phosphate acyltransferase